MSKELGPRNAVYAGIGATIRTLRIGPGLRFQTQGEIARKVNCSKAQICDIENANRRPSVNLLARIAKALRAKMVWQDVPCEHCEGTGKQKRFTLVRSDGGTGAKRD